MLEIKPTVKKFKVHTDHVEGAEPFYVLRTPSNAELRALAEAKEQDGLERTVELLAALGLPAQIGWQLDPEYTKQIVEAILPQKKS